MQEYVKLISQQRRVGHGLIENLRISGEILLSLLGFLYVYLFIYSVKAKLL